MWQISSRWSFSALTELLVTLLIRVNRQKQRMLTYGLSEHYRNIFEITRLSDAIHIYNTETEALAAARTL